MEELSFWVFVLTSSSHFLLVPMASVSTSSQSIIWNHLLPLYALGTQLNLSDSLTYKVDLHSLLRDRAV